MRLKKVKAKDFTGHKCAHISENDKHIIKTIAKATLF